MPITSINSKNITNKVQALINDCNTKIQEAKDQVEAQEEELQESKKKDTNLKK